MKSLVRTGWILLVVLVMANTMQAYESELFSTVDFFRNQYINGYLQPNLYDMSQNPAFFEMAYPENLTIYKLSAQRQLNLYSRYFDPHQEDDIDLDLEWIKQLTTNSTLAAGVQYDRSFHNEVSHSLEKNYYDHYFAFTDTTTGDIEYQGPQLEVLYNHTLANQFLLGLEIDYGVERGLKDIYTECESIFRNIDLKAGLGYLSENNKTIIGVSTRYFNRQGKYEAVKEWEDALVRTWFGYHLYVPENPRRINRKDDNREGYQFGLQFERKEIFNSPLGIRMNGNYGIQKNKIKVGKPTYTRPRGYWERSGYDFTGSIYYISNGIYGQLFFNQCNYDDWASPKNYDVLALKKDEQVQRVGSLINIDVFDPFELDAGFEMRIIKTNYIEYTADFYYNEGRNEKFLLLGTAYNLNSISSIKLLGTQSIIEPDFHWTPTETFNIFGIQTGYVRQFIFGKLEANFNYQVSNPDNVKDKIEKFGFSVIYRK